MLDEVCHCYLGRCDVQKATSRLYLPTKAGLIQEIIFWSKWLDLEPSVWLNNIFFRLIFSDSLKPAKYYNGLLTSK